MGVLMLMQGTHMQYIKLGAKLFFIVGAPYLLLVTVDTNAARTPQLFILQERFCQQVRTTTI